MVAPELKLAKTVTADKRAGPPMPRIVVERAPEVEPRQFYSTFCLRTFKLTDTLEAAQAVQRLHRMEKRQSHIMTNAESESERSLREP